jgi:hypothetical protein
MPTLHPAQRTIVLAKSTQSVHHFVDSSASNRPLRAHPHLRVVGRKRGGRHGMGLLRLIPFGAVLAGADALLDLRYRRSRENHLALDASGLHCKPVRSRPGDEKSHERRLFQETLTTFCSPAKETG